MEHDLYLNCIFLQQITQFHYLNQDQRNTILQYLDLLRNPVIQIDKLKELAFNGIPNECKGLRSLSWKLMIGILPGNRKLWKERLSTLKNDYEYYISQSFNKEKLYYKDDGSKLSHLIDNDLPEWCLHAKNQIIAEIHKDARRTRQEVDFFSEKILIKSQNIQKLMNFKQIDINSSESTNEEEIDVNIQYIHQETHRDVIARILYVYGYLNPSVGYVQGMNEILAPLYYIFYQDDNEIFRENAEAETFFAFSSIMAEIQDGFMIQMDQCPFGIQNRMKILNKMLKIYDKEISNKLDILGIKTHHYSLRWLMILLTQEFKLTQALRLWDTLLSVNNKLTYLNYIIISIMESLKNKIVKAHEFSEVMNQFKQVGSLNLEYVLNHSKAVSHKLSIIQTPKTIPKFKKQRSKSVLIMQF